MSTSPARGGGRWFNIKASLFGVLALLATLFFIPTTIDVYSSHQRLVQSQQMGGLIHTGIDLFQSVRNFGYERGRTNVVLKHAGSPAEMAANRSFVQARRQEGEQALARALTELDRGMLPGMDQALASLKQAREKVGQLRKRTEAEMLLTYDRRDHGLPAVWFAAMTDMIGRIRGLLEILCGEISQFDGPTAVISQMMLTSISLRDECAPEMALLSGVMLSGQPIDEQVRLKIMYKRGMTQQLWNDLRTWSTNGGGPRLRELGGKFQDLYFNKYLPLGKEILEASLTAGPYRLSQKEFLDTGVAAIEALVDIMGAVVEEGSQRAAQVSTEALRDFTVNLVMLVLGVVLIVSATVTVVRRVINPLAELTLTTRRIAYRDLAQPVPYLSRLDEIGAVARALEVLKGNTQQMIDDNQALREGKAALEKALSEVRALRGLLPICSNCKKIRDDQGYWQQLEAYISEHSEAQFSHGICPECVKKLYPELVK